MALVVWVVTNSASAFAWTVFDTGFPSDAAAAFVTATQVASGVSWSIWIACLVWLVVMWLRRNPEIGLANRRPTTFSRSDTGSGIES